MAREYRSVVAAPAGATLAQKMMTDLFRDPHVPKGAINMNADKGVAEVEDLTHLAGDSVPRS